MAVWALADLHLAIGVPEKSMEVFGEAWENYIERIKNHWKKNVSEDDLVLLPGDISWGMRLHEARKDLEWIHSLPGTKVLIKGNHDYWWSSLKQVTEILPPSMHLIQNDSMQWKGTIIGGTKLWDTQEYNFRSCIVFKDNPRSNQLTARDANPIQAEKIFVRELHRLEMSLKNFDSFDGLKIAMTHYPPIGLNLADSRASKILEKHKVDICVFGHLHNLRPGSAPFGIKNGIRYQLVSCDYIDCCPVLLVP